MLISVPAAITMLRNAATPETYELYEGGMARIRKSVKLAMVGVVGAATAVITGVPLVAVLLSRHPDQAR